MGGWRAPARLTAEARAGEVGREVGLRFSGTSRRFYQ